MIRNEQTALTRGERVALPAVLILALVLRLIRLGTFSYWHDEVHNLIASEDLYALVVHGNLVSNHPPLPYFLVAAWRAIGMDGSEWTMRLLPAFAGVAAVAAMFALGRRLVDARTGLCAAFLLAISPLHVYHSQDLKEYIYLPFVAQVMVLFFYRAVQENRRRDWLAYGLLAGLACYTEIFVGPLLVAINLWAMNEFRSTRGRWKGWFWANLLGAMLFVPWLGIMFRKAVATMVESTTWWLPAPTLFSVLVYLKSVAFGYSAPGQWHKAALLFFLMAVAVGAVALWRKNRSVARLLLAWAVIPVAIVFAVSHITESIFLVRALLPYAMALYIIAGAALAGAKPTALRAGIGGAVTVLMAVGLYCHYERIYTADEFPYRPGIHAPRDTAGASRYILSHWQEGDIVVHSSAPTWLTFYWYGFRGRPQYNAGVGADYINFIHAGNPRNTDDPRLRAYWPEEPQIVTAGANRIWFVFADWERAYLGGNASNVWRWLDSHYSEIDHQDFQDLEIALYAQPAQARAVARDKDDGISADVTYDGTATPYHKVDMDAAQIATAEQVRRGELVVRWEEGDPSSPSDFILAQGTEVRIAAFSIKNTGAAPAKANVEFFSSDALVDAASFMEPDPREEVWHVYGQHNPSPPPAHFDAPVAAAAFQVPGSASLDTEISLPAGTYRSYLRTLGLPGDDSHGRSLLSVLSNNGPVFDEKTVVGDPAWRWGWLPGYAANISAGPVSLTLTAVAKRVPAYCDVSAIAFRRVFDGMEDDGAVPAIWPGEVTLAPGEERRFSVQIDARRQRSDVWVYGYGLKGRDYHIFSVKAH